MVAEFSIFKTYLELGLGGGGGGRRGRLERVKKPLESEK